MKSLIGGLVLAAATVSTGLCWQDAHVRLARPGRPADQRVVAHEESPYTSMTWVASATGNVFELRFFERVEGGVRLHPSWAELIALAQDDPRLAHLVPRERTPRRAGRPDPGTLNAAGYFSLFPAGLLLHRHGEDAVRKPWRVLVVGLGGGAGIAHLAHHFPGAAITVVDIDAKVIQMVREHYPLMGWLGTQRRSDGELRLRFVARDARRFVRDESRAGRSYDLIILDAFTSGGTIPPHLLTREFFLECRAALVDGGVVMANVIGSYGSLAPPHRGPKRRVVGGALRTMRAAGLRHAWSVPVLRETESPGEFRAAQERNVILLAARHPIDPERAPQAWARIDAWMPYPELPAERWVTRTDALVDARGTVLTTLANADETDAAVPALAAALRPLWRSPELPQYLRRWATHDPQLVAAVADAGRALRYATGWDDHGAAAVVRTATDVVLVPREIWRVSTTFARRAALNDPEALVGPVDGMGRPSTPTWLISDAPLFTDQMPNADILNR